MSSEIYNKFEELVLYMTKNAKYKYWEGEGTTSAYQNVEVSVVAFNIVDLNDKDHIKKQLSWLKEIANERELFTEYYATLYKLTPEDNQNKALKAARGECNKKIKIFFDAVDQEIKKLEPGGAFNHMNAAVKDRLSRDKKKGLLSCFKSVKNSTKVVPTSHPKEKPGNSAS